MNEFNFELVYKLKNGEDPEAYLDTLFEAGCDDALVGVGNVGYIELNYTCEASKSQQTFVEAIKKVKKAIPHAVLEKAEPYLLNSTELAFYFGFTKQNMRKYTRNKSSINHPFPVPAVSGKTSYWYLYEVAVWFTENTDHKFEKNHLMALKTVVGLNRAIESQRLHFSDSEEKHYTDVLQRA